jgi:hypothetical protein
VGAGYALGKAGLYERGWRLRAVGAYGRYHYDGALLIDGDYVPTAFDGEDAFLWALVGYQLCTARLITKLLVGIEAEDQHIVPNDPNNLVQGTALGLRLQQETWFDISPRFYLSADASYGTAFQEYCVLARVGFGARPQFALGLERDTIGNEEYDADRAAGFLRMNFRNTEFTLSGRRHRQLSRRRSERLCRARHLSITLSLRDQPLPNCTAGPAPAVLGLNVCLRDTDRTGSPRQASPSLVVHPV